MRTTVRRGCYRPALGRRVRRHTRRHRDPVVAADRNDQRGSCHRSAPPAPQSSPATDRQSVPAAPGPHPAAVHPDGRWTSTRAVLSAAAGQNCWPPAGSYMAATGQDLMAADTHRVRNSTPTQTGSMNPVIRLHRTQGPPLLDRRLSNIDPSRASTLTSGPSTPHIPRLREGSSKTGDRSAGTQAPRQRRRTGVSAQRQRLVVRFQEQFGVWPSMSMAGPTGSKARASASNWWNRAPSMKCASSLPFTRNFTPSTTSG